MFFLCLPDCLGAADTCKYCKVSAHGEDATVTTQDSCRQQGHNLRQKLPNHSTARDSPMTSMISGSAKAMLSRLHCRIRILPPPQPQGFVSSWQGRRPVGLRVQLTARPQGLVGPSGHWGRGQLTAQFQGRSIGMARRIRPEVSKKQKSAQRILSPVFARCASRGERDIIRHLGPC